MNSDDKKKILLVDDEAIIAMHEKQQLENAGYSIKYVMSGKDAVQQALNKDMNYDLILMDINLGSGIDGTQAAEEILKEKDIPVVFLSSHTEPEIVEKTEKITSYGYVVKDSDITVLDASIKMAFKLFQANKLERIHHKLLQKSEDRLSKIMLAANDGMWDWDLITNEVYFDPRYYQMSGYTIDEFPHALEEFQNRVHPDEVDYVMKEAEKHLKGETENFDVKFRFRKRTGDWQWIQGKGIIVERNDDGLPRRFIGTHRDISELKEVEAALRESSQILAFAVQGAGMGVWDWYPQNGKVTYCDRWADMLEYRPDEIEPHIDFFKRHIHPNDLQAVLERLMGHVEGRLPEYESEHRLRTKFGKWKWILDRGRIAETNKDGRPVRVTGVIADITERKLAEEKIINLLGEKELILKEVHHRLKNNIASIEGLLSLQAASTDNAEVKTALQESKSRIQSIRVLYDKLLIGKDYRDIAIKNYIDSLIDSLVAVFPESKNVSFERNITDFNVSSKKAIPIGIIINELMTNIFKHAFKCKNGGHVIIELIKADNLVTLKIKDNGIGIDEGIDLNKSPGFGLTLVKMLTGQLKGKYSMENDNGTMSILEFEI